MLDVLICSLTTPTILNPPRKYVGSKYSSNLVLYDDNTITISPFKQADISPKDDLSNDCNELFNAGFDDSMTWLRFHANRMDNHIFQ